jgi:hypothetical protein
MSAQISQNAQRPDAITKLSAWLGADMARNCDAWLYQLSGEDVRDLETAATHFQSLGIEVGEISQETFPLATFGAHILAAVSPLCKFMFFAAGARCTKFPAPA